jgi:hypothetical protein
MVNLRCTQKLFKRLPLELRMPSLPQPSTIAHPSSTVLGDWYLTLLVIRPAHLVLAVSERSRLAVVLPAKELKTLPQRLPQHVETSLLCAGIPHAQVEQELGAMREWRITPSTEGTGYRSVLGTQKEFLYVLGIILDEGERDPLSLTARLQGQLCGPQPYHYPVQTARDLFGVRENQSRSWPLPPEYN